MKTYTFYVRGMHCASCVVLTESELAKIPGVQNITARLSDRTIHITGDFGTLSDADVAAQLTQPLKEYGYEVVLGPDHPKKNWSEFSIALPIALGLTALFVLLQKLGIVQLIGGNDVTYQTAFVIGIVASLSTCMAVVGGLLLSLSATFAKGGSTTTPHILFHVGRIVSFFVLGGVIGAIGSAFTLTTHSTFILGLVVAIVMLILGINLLDIFPWAERLQLTMPKFIAIRTQRISALNHVLTPLTVGCATFFLPCGFTQSMQLYTLTTGSFLKGGLTMLSFALGTLPVLALVSFSSYSIKNSPKSGIFFKSAGIIVILFALFTLINSFVIIGLIPPLFNF